MKVFAVMSDTEEKILLGNINHRYMCLNAGDYLLTEKVKGKLFNKVLDEKNEELLLMLNKFKKE